MRQVTGWYGVVGLLVVCGILAGCGRKVEVSVEITGENELTSDEKQEGWKLLFDGESLEEWQLPVPGSWVVENGTMSMVGKGNIWTAAQYGNFEFACDFKITPKCNSGIFIRTGDIENNVQTGIEIQILDPALEAHSDRNACGAVYDCLAPKVQASKPVGEWNNIHITCQGSMIDVVMNDVAIINMNLDDWSTPEQNPDGTPNKFKTAMKDFPRVGYIGLQYHGAPLWFRNVKIREL